MGNVLSPYSFSLQGGYPQYTNPETYGTTEKIPPLGDWQILATNYITSKLTGRVISPRPDVETDTNSALAYYRTNHSEMDYKVRICVKGMAWPFKYELITAPVGATIGEELLRSNDVPSGKTIHSWTDDYAILTWLNPTAGTETFTVRITDQESTTLDVTWTTTQDDTKFVFVDSVGGNDVNAGTFAAPLATFQNGVWKGSDTDATYIGKQVVFRTGTYPIYSSTIPTNMTLNSTYKPMVYRAFNDEVVTFGTDSGGFDDGGSTHDATFIGINCSGSRADAANLKIFRMAVIGNRQVFWNMSFDTIGIGTVGNDNPGCIVHLGNSTNRQDIVVVDCYMDSTVGSQLWSGFNNDGMLLENNFLDGVIVEGAGSNGNYGLHAKDDTSNISIRANTIIGSIESGCIEVSNQNSAGQPLIENQEVCWNTLKNTNGVAVKWNGASSTPDGINTYDYRNNAVSTASYSYTMSGNASPTPVTVSADAQYGLLGIYNLSNYVEVAPLPQVFLVTDFDVNAKLTGTARTNYLGTKGSEVTS